MHSPQNKKPGQARHLMRIAVGCLNNDVSINLIGEIMSLKDSLKSAKTEEDVKDAYIRALGLKNYSKNMVDIQTKEVWFEAKEAGTSPVAMFAQLLVYVKIAKNTGDHLPPFLAVIDREKAAIMETAHAEDLLADKTIVWPKSGSRVISRDKITQEFVSRVSAHVAAHYVVYNLDSHEKNFILALRSAIKTGKIIRTPITPDNLRQVFDKWIEYIGSELGGVDEADYALLFFADIMHDGKRAAMANLPARLLFDGEKPVFVLNGQQYDLVSDRGYRNFWAIYHRPPDEEYRTYLLERRDSLLPLDERSFKGAFYTPLKVVDKAYDLLAETLGANWQQNYIVWDMCCGVGNLEVKHSNHRNIFMSTLDKADIDVMNASHTCVAATKFQYDYLNDDIDAFGQIDYGLTNKVPMELQQAIADAKAKEKGTKKILVLMNPPYAEVGTGAASGNKAGVAATKFAAAAMTKYGKAKSELFAQFLARIQLEIPNTTIAMFSKLKHLNAPNFEKFRSEWQPKYLGGFLIESKMFDGMKGKFPIGFLIWNTVEQQTMTVIETVALDRDLQDIKPKLFYNLPAKTYLNVWLDRPRKNNCEMIPLKGAVVPATSEPRVRHWSDNAVAYMYCGKNDLQHTVDQTVLLSGPYGQGDGFYLTGSNLWQAAIIFSVRRLIKPTWMNDRDQFLQPSEPLTDEFKNDCLIWMLFNGSNATAGADGLEWNTKQWSLVNHFIPFTETEVGASGRFESRFMVDYLQGKPLSPEAQAVLDAGREIFRAYHKAPMPRKIREELKLNRADAGWYQVRKALEANAENQVTDFSDFKAAYLALSEKLRPQVYSLGFLKE
jgi:hypothetical protein